MNIKVWLNKLYYKYIDTSIINHYRLLIITEEYINISEKYFWKYPNAYGWKNLNKQLFETNMQAEIDYHEYSTKQQELLQLFFTNSKIICNNSDCNNFIICSEKFQSFYIDKKYHYMQFPQNVINDIIQDIQNNE